METVKNVVVAQEGSGDGSSKKKHPKRYTIHCVFICSWSSSFLW